MGAPRLVSGPIITETSGLLEEAAEARALAAFFRGTRTARDLLAYAESLEADITVNTNSSWLMPVLDRISRAFADRPGAEKQA
jgi:hypothetical protein